LRAWAVDLTLLCGNHAEMDFEDASPRARPDDLVAQLGREDLDRLSVSDLDDRIAIDGVHDGLTDAKILP